MNARRRMLSTTAALYGQGLGEQVALITDGRFSGATVELEATDEGTLELDAGGFAIGAGIRLYF